MINDFQREQICKLRAEVAAFQAEVIASDIGCTADPIPVQMIWDAVITGDTDSLAYWTDYARTETHLHGWEPTVQAAEVVLKLWQEFEKVHGDGSLLDIAATMRIFARHPDLEGMIFNACSLRAKLGTSLRDCVVDLSIYKYERATDAAA